MDILGENRQKKFSLFIFALFWTDETKFFLVYFFSFLYFEIQARIWVSMKKKEINVEIEVKVGGALSAFFGFFTISILNLNFELF